jgi:hypothetical protein
MLAGDVNVTFAGNVLTLTGDIDPNEVELLPGANPGEVRIEGIDTTINGPTSIVDPIASIVVDLQGGSDTFRIRGDATGNLMLITGTVEIRNSDGLNENEIIRAQLNSTLTVLKNTGNSESNLEIDGSTIVDVVTVNNNNGGQGASKTVIKNGSHLQDDLNITNGNGQDILIVYDSIIDGNANISNGAGDTRTVFGLQEDPVIRGNLNLICGPGNDRLIVYDTDIWGTATVNFGDGHTDTNVELANIGLGAPLGWGDTFDIDSGAGHDAFSAKQMTVRDNLDIRTTQAPVPGTYGSSVDIDQSVIGNKFEYAGDNGYDDIDIDETRVNDDLILSLLNGSSVVTFEDNCEVGDDLRITTGAGADRVRLEETIVRGDADIRLGGGIDLLEILAASRLLGTSSLDGGAQDDKLVREIAPPNRAIEIAYLVLETFEEDEFIV